MSGLHTNEEQLDQYALGTLSQELLPALEEHLLICESCQSRLDASEEFATLFRTAAVQPDVRSKRRWRMLWNHPVASWAGAAAIAAILLVVVGPFRSVDLLHKPPATPPAVLMQSLRGPEAPATVEAGHPALLVFDIVPPAGANDYEARIVNPVGIQIFSGKAISKDGRLSLLVDRLPPGSYWVRVFRTGNSEPIAEYGLQAR